MAGGYHNATAGMTAEVDGEVESGCGYLTQIDNIDPAGDEPRLQGAGQLRGAESGIVANIDCLFIVAAQNGAQSFAETIGEVGGNLCVGEAADIIVAEDYIGDIGWCAAGFSAAADCRLCISCCSSADGVSSSSMIGSSELG